MKVEAKILTHLVNGRNVWIDLPAEERVLKATQETRMIDLLNMIETVLKNERILKIEFM